METILSNKLLAWIIIFVLCSGYIICFAYPLCVLLLVLDGCEFYWTTYALIPEVIIAGIILVFYYSNYIDYLFDKNIL